jgi:hypothetical protein
MMILSELIGKFGLRVYTPPADGLVEVAHGYASDLLSDVIANAGKDSLWVTMQIHGRTLRPSWSFRITSQPMRR